MATYNTAFGSLPSPETLTGGVSYGSGDEDEFRPRNRLQQYGAQQQTLQQPQLQAPTFAQMQEQGQARPAPPQLQAPDIYDGVASAPAPAPTTGTLPQRTSEALDLQTYTPTPTPPPVLVQQTQQVLDSAPEQLPTDSNQPINRTSPIGPMTPPTLPPGYRPAGPGTVETPLPNIDQFRYTPENPPPANAPNGSTFRDANGFTYVKRGGSWGYDAALNAGRNPTGYAALTLQTLGGGGTFNVAGGALEQFLRSYGTPSNTAQWQQLASQSGMTVDQLRQFIENNNRNPTLRFQTQQELADLNEWQRFMNANPQYSPNQARADFWTNNVFVPERLRGPDGSPFRRRTYDELVAAGYQPYGGRELFDRTNVFDQEVNRLINERGIADPTRDDVGPWTTDPANWEKVNGRWQPHNRNSNGVNMLGRWSLIGGRWAPTSVVQEIQQTAGRIAGLPAYYEPGAGGRTVPVETPEEIRARGGLGGGFSLGGFTPTQFSGGNAANIMSQLQQVLGAGGGVSMGGGFRPSGAGAPAEFQLSQQARDLQTRLSQVLSEMQGAPSVFDTEAYRARLAANEAELEAQYKTERERLDEELARRGLSASTLGSDRMQSLAGTQARALASMRADLLKEASQQQDRRQEMMLRTMADLSGQLGSQEIAAYNANVERYRATGQMELDAQRLRQDFALRGAELSLQQARDMVDREFKQKALDQQLKEMLSREALTREELGLRGNLTREEYALREKLLGQEITSRETLAGQQLRGGLLQALLGNLDLSGLTAEQLNALLSSMGLSGVNIPTTPPTTPPPTGPTGPTGPTSTNSGGEPIRIDTIPTDLSRYPEGQQFIYNGQLLVKRNNILFNAFTGLPFDTRE